MITRTTDHSEQYNHNTLNHLQSWHSTHRSADKQEMDEQMKREMLPYTWQKEFASDNEEDAKDHRDK